MAQDVTDKDDILQCIMGQHVFGGRQQVDSASTDLSASGRMLHVICRACGMRADRVVPGQLRSSTLKTWQSGECDVQLSTFCTHQHSLNVTEDDTLQSRISAQLCLDPESETAVNCMMSLACVSCYSKETSRRNLRPFCESCSHGSLQSCHGNGATSKFGTRLATD